MPRKPLSDAHKELLAWYRKQGRDLPWRQTRDPYRVLVSEIMLQQTQVDRVIPFYERFLQLFPNETAIAQAEVEALHRAWKGLGYPSRVERLQAACIEVLTHHDSVWPDTPEGLQQLPGIGPYTAGAVATFAFDRSVAVVDTNIARVYARRDGLPLPLNKKKIWYHAECQVPARQAIAYGNAMMDLGATICTARNPDCSRCPWLKRCVSQHNHAIHAETGNPLKVASKKKRYGVAITDRKKPRQTILLALVHHDGRYLIAQRPLHVHLGGYWEIPGGKKEPGEDDRACLARELMEETGLELLAARPFVTANYEYDDRYLQFKIYRCRVFNPEAAQPLASDFIEWVSPEDFITREFPPANAALLERFRDYHKLPTS